VGRADEEVQAEVEILPAVPAAADEEAVEAGGVRKERADERRKRQKEESRQALLEAVPGHRNRVMEQDREQHRAARADQNGGPLFGSAHSGECRV
jgi:hypothetical protein